MILMNASDKGHSFESDGLIGAHSVVCKGVNRLRTSIRDYAIYHLLRRASFLSVRLNSLFEGQIRSLSFITPTYHSLKRLPSVTYTIS